MKYYVTAGVAVALLLTMFLRLAQAGSGCDPYPYDHNGDCVVSSIDQGILASHYFDEWDGTQWLTPIPPSSPSSTPALSPTFTATSTVASATATPTVSPTFTSLPATPTPSATPTSTSVPTATNTPSSETRNKYLQPFASDSPWNMPIGSGAQYTPANLGSPSHYFTEREFVLLDPNAPLRTYQSGGGWPAECNGGSPNGQLRVPDGYLIEGSNPSYFPNNAGGGLRSDNNTLQEFLTACRNNGTGTLYAGYNLCTHTLTGNGGIGLYCAHGGSGLSGVAGSLRTGEMATGTPIRHVLKVTLPASTLSDDGVGVCDGGYRWPAIIADNGWSDDGGGHHYSGNVQSLCMGALLALSPSTPCNTGAELTRRICAALRDYGARVVDIHPSASGWRPFTLNGEPGVNPNGGEMIGLFQQLQVVTNDGPSSVGGGGTPRVPLLPPLP